LTLLQRSLLLLILLPALSACGSATHQSAYYQAYQQSLQDTEPSAVDETTILGFADIFANIQQDDLARFIDATYAEKFYFNDTFRTLRDKAALIVYLEETGSSVEQLNVEIKDIARSGHEVYVRWNMQMQFSVFGKIINSQSVGMTHLRFNEDGQIILHQDFWDGADAFYQHLPVIGIWFRQIREQL
jgi:hypothetical protein